MKYLKYIMNFSQTFTRLAIMRLFGKKISFKITDWISSKASIKIQNGGSIVLGNIVGICPNVELSANGGTIIFEGNNYINRNTMIQSHGVIKIGKNTTIGPNVLVYDHDHNIKDNHKSDFIIKNIKIGSDVWVGAGVIILKGVTIGNGSVIAAGTLVTKDVPENVVVYQDRKEIYKIKSLGKLKDEKENNE